MAAALHTHKISLKFHVLLPGLNVCFITSAFQGSQSFWCAGIKPRKWLKFSDMAIRCILVLGIKTGYIKVWLQKPSSADATSALSTSTLWCGSVWTSPPACVHPLPHVAQWESKSHGEEKKHLLNSVSMLSQWWSMTGSYICYCNTAWVTTKQRNNVIVVKTFAGVSPGAIWPQWRQRGRAASSCLLALLEGTAAPWESNWSVGLDMWATTWFMVM